MRAVNIYKRFLTTITTWEDKLESYSISNFQKKINAADWSIGQVYEHVTSSTLNFHAHQIELCLRSNNNSNKHKTFIGWLSLLIKRIPPVEIKIPPEENIEPFQPGNKEIITERLNHLKKLFFDLAVAIDASKSRGKTNHPGMGYLNAAEWFQMIEMHFRYHEKQKSNIDKQLSL